MTLVRTNQVTLSLSKCASLDWCGGYVAKVNATRGCLQTCEDTCEMKKKHTPVENHSWFSTALLKRGRREVGPRAILSGNSLDTCS